MSTVPTHYQVVNKTIVDYIEQTLVLKTKPERIVYIQGLFDYLSTAAVKPLLKNAPEYANFRNSILEKIHEFSADSYLRVHRQKYHRLFAVFQELFTYLVEDDSVPVRRSEREKQHAVERFNASIVNAEAAAAAKPVSIKVKVLPRRSARLMNKL